ncbi:MAG: hypothetical protein F7C33_04520 [Desulfurococcales archaeon]|nr:hypothetical protein [Desulfurococcales archaeon]
MGKLSDVVRTGSYVYMASIANNLGGYTYWLIVSILAGPSPLGITSAIIGLASLIVAALSLGVNVALQRFIGACEGRGDVECRRRYFWSSLTYGLVVYSVSASIVLFLGLFGRSISNFTPLMLEFVSVLILVMGLSQILWFYMIARLKTKLLFEVATVSNLLKIAVGSLLVYLGFDWIGAVTGYLLMSVTLVAVNGAVALREEGLRFIIDFYAIRELLRAGASAWLPNFIVLMGQWLGVLAVFGYKTSIETGHYYAAYSIAMFLIAVATLVLGVLLPILSAMESGREELTARSTRLALLAVAPLALYIAYYPRPVLRLLGPSYVAAAPALTILTLSSLPYTTIAAANNLAYSYGKYRLVLALGLAQALPRILLYPVLTPRYGALGTALAVYTGAVIGGTTSLYFSKLLSLEHPYRDYLVGILLPLGILLPVKLLGTPWLMAGLLALTAYPLYVRLGVVPREDVEEVLEAIGGQRLRSLLRRISGG